MAGGLGEFGTERDGLKSIPGVISLEYKLEWFLVSKVVRAIYYPSSAYLLILQYFCMYCKFFQGALRGGRLKIPPYYSVTDRVEARKCSKCTWQFA